MTDRGLKCAKGEGKVGGEGGRGRLEGQLVVVECEERVGLVRAKVEFRVKVRGGGGGGEG